MKHLAKIFLLLSILLLTSCESRRTIVNGLDEREANEIVVFLSTRNIDVAKVRSTEGTGGGGQKLVLWDISVRNDQATDAMSILNQAGLPRKRGQNLLGIFANVGLVPSEMQEKIRYQAGLAEQIASTIRKIDGVLDAEVQISFPEEDPLNPGAEKKEKATASVYVKHSGVLDDPNSHLIPKIKRLVAASVPGLSFDNVTVIPDRARFSEVPQGLLIGSEERPFVNVWSLIVAQESLTRFRIIFFSFTLLLLSLLLLLLWLLWKLYPILRSHGGLKELFTIKQIQDTAEPKKEEKPGDTEHAAKEVEEQGLVDEDIDET
ncbi:Type III secretion periplasmic lipoprotein [Chlamydiales bacterium STE3]|nr:Type III secretion periplasmic lipoprotein [Chlamydiales bacterium STE3]